MKASDLVVRCLEAEGVKYVFGLPGEEIEDLLFSLEKSSIQFIPTRHEQGAAFFEPHHFGREAAMRVEANLDHLAVCDSQTGGIVRVNLQQLLAVQCVEAFHLSRHRARVEVEQAAVGGENQGILLILDFRRRLVLQGHELPLAVLGGEPLGMKELRSGVLGRRSRPLQADLVDPVVRDALVAGHE